MYRTTRRDMELILMGAALASKQCADRIDHKVTPRGIKIVPAALVAELIGPLRGKQRSRLNAWLSFHGIKPDEAVSVLDSIIGHMEAVRKKEAAENARRAACLAGAVSVEAWIRDVEEGGQKDG